MSEQADPILDCAEAILTSVEDLIKAIDPPLTRPDRPRVALFMTMAEQFECALYLARARAGSHSAVHVRSMVEALITMNLLGMEIDYVHQFMFDKVKGQKTLYERLLVDPNLAAEHRHSFEEIVVACQEEMALLESKGAKKRRHISENFGAAGLTHLAAPYGVLCGFSHNDLSAIALRHQGEKGMTYRAAIDPQVLQSIFAVAIDVMVRATRPLPEIAGFPDGHFEKVFQQMNNDWGTYMFTASGSAA